MITFVIAIGYLCFQTSTAQRAITAVVSGIVISSVAWEIAVHWKSLHPRGYYLYRARKLVGRINHRLMRLFNKQNWTPAPFYSLHVTHLKWLTIGKFPLVSYPLLVLNFSLAYIFASQNRQGTRECKVVLFDSTVCLGKLLTRMKT